jgi:hypothetical protein
MLCNGVEDVEGVNSDVRLLLSDSNESVVEEDIEPFFIEVLLLLDEVSKDTI